MQEKLIYSFEGLDGGGKTTTIGLLRTYYESKGYSVAAMKSPSNSHFGQYIRSNLNNLDDWQKNRMFALDLEHSIRMIPSESDMVLYDRHIDSIYTSNAGCNLEEFVELANRIPLPAATLYLDVTPEKAMERALSISDHPLSIDWLKLKHSRYRELIDLYPERYYVIDAALPLNEVFNILTSKINADLERINK